MRGHEDDNARLATSNFQTERIVFAKAQGVKEDHQSSELQILLGWRIVVPEQPVSSSF